jgi:hypothetical protein
MLMRAAAARWRVSLEAARRDGVITHGGKRLRFGEVAEAAMQLAPAVRRRSRCLADRR